MTVLPPIRSFFAPVAVAPALRIVGRDWMDRQQLFVPRFVSALSILRRTPAERDVYLDWAAATGFNGVRVFAGALTWAGQTPATALAALPGLIDACAARGLAVEVTALTDTITGYDWLGHLVAVADLCEPHPHVLLEAINEIGHPTNRPADPAICAQTLRSIYPHAPWAIGAPLGTDEPLPDGTWPAGQGTYSTSHLYRGRKPIWDMARRVREIYAVSDVTGEPCLNNEPIGADETDQPGRRSADPAVFATLGALDAAFRGVGGVHHSQAGLHAVLPGPVQRRCADAYVLAHRVVRGILGESVGRYYNVGHQGSPVVSADFAQVTRIYSFVTDNRAVSVHIGEQTPTARLAPGWASVQTAVQWVGADGRLLRLVELVAV